MVIKGKFYIFANGVGTLIICKYEERKTSKVI